MRELKILFGYEMKKIFLRRLTWVALVLTLIACIGPAVGSLLGTGIAVDGLKLSSIELLRMDMQNKEKLAGRWIDQALLEETIQGYAMSPKDLSSYSAMMEYLKYSRPYQPIYNFIRSNSNMDWSEMSKWKADETDLYAKRLAMLEELYYSYQLSEQEKEFWREKESCFTWPVRFEITESYLGLFHTLSTLCFIIPVCLSICLSNIFAGEHLRRTDQIILCSKKGLSTMYWSKILAGVSFSILYSLGTSLIAFLPCLIIYGADGFYAAFQLIYAKYSLSLTAGEASLIMYGTLIVTSVLYAIIIMGISEAARSGIAALSIIAIYIIAAMIYSVPRKYRILAQIWDWLPGSFVIPPNIFDLRMIYIFGKLFLSWQAVPVIYLIAAAGIAMAGVPVYRKYQVSGR